MQKQNIKRRFFQTTEGRKVVFFAAGATTIGLFFGNFLPHTVGLKYYREFMQCYDNGVERPVSERVRQRLEYAMDKLEINDYEKLIIRPFTVFGFDLFHAGSTKYRFGCALGIPANYNYTNVDEINRNEIRFRDEKIKWNTESGKLLEESIVLSPDEQVFGLCKTLLQLQSHRILLNSLFPSISFLMVYTLGSYLNKRLDLLSRPFALRCVMYSILSCFGVGSWSFLKDFTQVSYDADIDKKLSSMGPEFVEAGIRYYDKNLKKNMALRALLGDNTYTAKGNENYFLRQKSMPLTLRKTFFEQKLKELQGSTETSKEAVQ